MIVYSLIYDQTFSVVVSQSRVVREPFTCLITGERSGSGGRGTRWIDDRVVNLNKTINNQNKFTEN